MAYITGLKKQVEGTTITITDNDYDKVQDLQLKGNTTQDGTPTPDTPVPINVVTGRQEINVCGKNLFNGVFQQGGLNLGNDGTEQTQTTRIRSDFVEVQPNTTYTISNNNTNLDNVGIGLYRANRGYDSSHKINNGGWNDFPKSFTTQSDTKYVRFAFRKNDNSNITPEENYQIQLELENATQYEKYNGISNEINLGKNLVNMVETNKGVSGSTGAIYSPNVNYLGVEDYIPVLPNTTYTITFEHNILNANLYIGNKQQDGTFIERINNGTSRTFTTGNNVYYIFPYLYKDGVTFETIGGYIQLEKNPFASSYSAYKTPIELCKIDTYQDSIKKATGKNIFDGELELGNYNTNTGEKISGSSYTRNTNFIPVEELTNYKLSLDGVGIAMYVFEYKADYSYNLTARKTIDENSYLTTNSGTKYINFRIVAQSTDLTAKIQIEKGETATPYEPYGTGYYIEKQIGKVVLDGSENWAYNSSNAVFVLSDAVNYIRTGFIPYSNYYKGEDITGYSQLSNNAIAFLRSATNNRMIIKNTDYTTANNFKSWLSAHNTIVYYVLATPTYTFIEDEELISQLEGVRLLEGLNNIIVSSSDLSSPIKLTYLSTDNPYLDVIYSQDDKNKLKIWFDDVELENAGYLCEKITKKSRILAETGQKIFSLSNFMATELEIILHGINLGTIKDQVKISIGTLIDEQNQTYEYIPLGAFNIENTPIINQNKITIKLRDNRVKFDFNYDAQPLLEANGGTATKRQILEDICLKAKVKHKIPYFKFENDEISIYDNTIKATMYIDYLAEQCGSFPALDRNGDLIFINLSDSYTWKIPKSILPQPYTLGTPYTIERVVYETGIIKYETSNDETLDTLYLNSANPYITSQSQVDYILSKFSNLKLDTVITQKMLGNPEIDPWDLIEVYDDATHEILFKTIANNIYTYNGKNWQSFNTEIGKEQRRENVTVNSEPTFKKWVKSEIDNANAQLIIQAGQIDEKLDESDFTKAEIIVKINDNTSQIKIDADNVDLEANDVLNILSGNTINLTGKNIQIASDNFNVDANGELTAHSATLEDIEIKDGQIYIPIIVDYDYTMADYQRALDIYLGTIQPTQEDLDKYDVNGDSQIDLQDVMTILKLVRTGLSHSNPGKIIFKADGANSKISIINSLNQDIVKFSFNGISVTDLDNNVTTIGAGSIGIRQGTNITEIFPPEILYDDATGTQGTITLSTNAGNFRYLEIYYYKNIQEKQYSSVKIYEPNGKNVLLLATWYGTDVSSTVPAMYVYREKAIISGTSITRAEAGAVAINTLGQSSAWQPDALYITRVVGYR